MPAVQVSAGTIEYADTGREDPSFVLLHGLAMDGGGAQVMIADGLMGRVGRLALVACEAFPDGRLVEIDDSYTLVPIDQPAALAERLRAFAAA